MKRILLLGILLPAFSFAQVPPVPSKASEDVDGVMAPGYWAVWNDAEQARIDADIDAYRKADASFIVGSVKRGTTVKVEQISSEFVFGASAFNWNQLGSTEMNARYRELFGSLFNRATVPFYWKDFERKSGSPRYEESFVDTEKWWNKATNSTVQPHWRRPSPAPIIDWCNSHGVQVHGHPLVWGSRKAYPEWMQFDCIPESERRALDTLEMIVFNSTAWRPESYERMSPEEIAATVPTYLKRQEDLTLQRVRDIMGHYPGKIHSWDVVNESARDFGLGVQDPSMAMCKSRYGIMFSDYTYKSFKVAESCNAGEGALLNINDYVVDDRFVNQVASLLSRGVKIDVIGSQMHLFQPQQCADIAAGTYHGGADKLVEPAAVRDFFGKLGSFGIPTCLSEITITSAGEGERGEMIQAIITRNLYRLWFSLPSMMGITWWNIVDDCGFAGEPNISGLFRRDMTPKISYYTLDRLLNHEWKTNLELAPKKGKISWRGFKGTYRITWTDSKGKEHEQTIVLE